MLNDKYIVTYLSSFADDLNQIADYISEVLGNPIAASAFVDSVEQAILERQTCASAFAPYPSKKKRINPYYYIPVGNYLIFYVLINDVMEVRRIIYGARNMDTEL